MKKFLIIIAPEGFQDQEFQMPHEALKTAGHEVKIASLNRGKCIGKYGMQVDADYALEDVNMDEFDALVLIGGPGAHQYQKNHRVHEIVQDAFKQEKVVGAICIAPTILAYAGVLTGMKVTVWNKDGQQDNIIRDFEGEYVDKDVVVDGRLVTANGPKAAQEFGDELVKMLS